MTAIEVVAVVGLVGQSGLGILGHYYLDLSLSCVVHEAIKTIPPGTDHCAKLSFEGGCAEMVALPQALILYPYGMLFDRGTIKVSDMGHARCFCWGSTPAPAPPGAVPPDTGETAGASPLPSITPAFPTVPLFSTEQIYICNRDGYDLKPLTSREGLIYFYASWAPDNHALVAMACREREWEARERQFKLATGRPRLLTLEGNERLLDDALTEALPVWSADSSKVVHCLRRRCDDL